MLYIKFHINNSEKYQDFQKVYEHMVMIRQPGFEFDEDEEQSYKSDWDLYNEVLERYLKIIPDYADTFLEEFTESDAETAGSYGFDIEGIFNYLEYSFEVDMNNLKKIKDNIGLVEFSTSNYPFGGLERFSMILKAFDLIPIECYNGFTVYEFDWTSEFTYESVELLEKTKLYKEGIKKIDEKIQKDKRA